MEILRLFNVVGGGLFFNRFQVIVELSCHSILVELFVIITVLYKFTIHVLRY